MTTLRARVSDDFKQRFESFCARTGRKEGELIRLALGRLIDANSGSEGEEEVPSVEFEKAELHLNVYVNASEKRAIEARAKSEGMRSSRWLVWLARRHLTEKPHFNPMELQALRDATRQLAAVGSNLNQISHALNINLNERDRLTGEHIQAVSAEVISLRSEIKRYVEMSLNRWGI